MLRKAVYMCLACNQHENQKYTTCSNMYTYDPQACRWCNVRQMTTSQSLSLNSSCKVSRFPLFHTACFRKVVKQTRIVI